MDIVIIDAKRLTEKTSAHEYLQKLFSFPDYYGKNLDALYDCLSERVGMLVIVQNSEAGGYAPRVIGVLDESAADGTISLKKIV